MKITIEWLKKREACDEGMTWFKKTFGESMGITPENIRKFDERLSYLGWLLAQDADMTKALINAGANIHAGDDWALRLAVRNGRTETVIALINAGANIHAGDDWALRLAVRNGRTEIVKLIKQQMAKEAK